MGSLSRIPASRYKLNSGFRPHITNMNLFKFSLKSARYFWKGHLGTVLGTIVGAGVLTGALLVGDSVKGSLLKQALLRIGSIDEVIASGDRFFSRQLASDLAGSGVVENLSPALLSRGIAILNERDSRANQVQILGIEKSFWEFDPSGIKPAHERGRVLLNAALADRLKAQPGDEILFRFEKPSLLTRESALSPQEDFNVVMRLVVGEVLPVNSLGAFSIFSGQSAPQSAFVHLEDLQEVLELEDVANMMLVKNRKELDAAPAPDLLNAISRFWTLTDASLSVAERKISDAISIIELSTPRVFIDSSVQDVAADKLKGHGVLTYFVNSVIRDNKSTPYSMVAGVEDPELIGDCPEDGIILNQWCAEDLGASPGDTINLEYYVMGKANRLETRTHAFRLHRVVPMEGYYADKSLMPEFPGVAEADSTRDWDAGFPLDLNRIRDKDEDYWKNHKGTPKAFIRLDDARKLWSNRYGETTGIRFHRELDEATSQEQLGASVLSHLQPGDVGYSLIPLRSDALKSASESFNFSSLFISFSFFLILSAMILVMLFFQFSMEKRLKEMGIFAALGFTPGRIRTMYLSESFVLAILGCAIGVLAGKYYAQAMIFGLTTAWKDAISSTPVEYFQGPATLITGWVSGILAALIAMGLAFWKYSRWSSVQLLASTGTEFDGNNNRAAGKIKPLRKIPWIAVVCLVGTVGLLFPGLKAQGPAAAGMFFGSGAMLLIAMHCLFNRWLYKLGSQSSGVINRWTMSVRNMARKPRRSLAVVASLASGTFLVTAISPFQMDASLDASKRSSGTGGFALYGSSIVPVVQDLKSEDGLDFFGFDPEEVENIEWVPMRLREGDDASCLNLNKAQQPRVLGVRTEPLESVNAFTFAGSPWNGIGDSELKGWNVLNATLEDGSIPAVVDAATLAWALKMKLGDTIDYPGPDGTPVKLRFVATLQGSMLQGTLIISDAHFQSVFPAISGYREFLIHSPEPEQTASILTRAMQDFGMEIMPSVDLLNRFNAVQNTYISTFQLLGQLGVILGSLAIAVIALRNVLERSGELGLLEAIGFRRAALRWQMGAEHWLLLLLGLVFGLLAASIAVMPVTLSGANPISFLPVIKSVSWILLSGSLWVLIALFLAFRGHFKNALREL